MNRDSWLVRGARLFQKIPLSLFRFIEKAVLLVGPNKKQSNIIILLALPRSGSTLTYQSLAHSFEVVYLSNMGNLLFQLPLIGGLLSKFKCKNHISNFRSSQGFIKGLCGPAEGLRYWSYWLNNEIDERIPLPITSTMKIQRRVQYITRIIDFLGKRNRPVVTGYLGHALIVKQLKSVFPEAIYIRLDRNPLTNALSILKIRKSEKKEWLSVFPKECLNHLKGNNIYEEVAAQVYWLNQRIDKEIDKQQTVRLSYEKLCSNPNSEIQKIVKFCEGKNIVLKKQKELPHNFIREEKININNPEVVQLIKAFQKLEGKFGRLQNSPSVT